MSEDLERQFVYHLKSEQFQGEEIHPLKNLKDVYPVIFESEITKYKGRESLAKMNIPILNVGWNEVVFLSPLHPQFIYIGLKEAGFNPKERYFFEIPVEVLNDKKVVIYQYRRWPPKDTPHFDLDDFETFSVDAYSQMKSLPDETLRYYKREALRGQKPFLFHLIPHILVCGSINISGVELLNWRDKV